MMGPVKLAVLEPGNLRHTSVWCSKPHDYLGQFGGTRNLKLQSSTQLGLPPKQILMKDVKFELSGQLVNTEVKVSIQNHLCQFSTYAMLVETNNQKRNELEFIHLFYTVISFFSSHAIPCYK